jgi:arylsulfatase A-like enzyme
MLDPMRLTPFASLCRFRTAAGATAIGVALTVAPFPTARAAVAHHQLLIVLDGLRPDYVTPQLMPALYALGQRGVIFANHHSVFPTVTRVNASSISTGAYPERHGLLGNSVFFPQVDPRRFLATDDRNNLLRIDAATGGRLLTTTTLGEVLEAAGRKLLVVSAGSSGSAWLINHKVAGGGIIHWEFTVPESLARASARVPPDAGATSEDKDRRAVDAFLRVGLPELNPTVTIMWLTDPDTTAHERGIGHPDTVAALHHLDDEIGRLQDGLKQAGLFGDFDIWVTSDHGFSTHTGAADLTAAFAAAGGTLPDGSPRVVNGGGAIYVRDHDRATIDRLVGTLQQTTGVGAIFTPAASVGALDGGVRGTLSFDAIRWQHERSADILYSPDWTDRPNRYGVPGTVASSGAAGHGSSSPFDIHNTLVAAGPDVKRGGVVRTPSASVDFAPTFLKLLGLDVPPSMQGRPLDEALSNGGDVPTVRTMQRTAASADGAYVVDAFFSIVQTRRGSYRYFDRTWVTRRPTPPSRGR